MMFYISNGETMLGGLFGARTCANCGRSLGGNKTVKYSGKSFCSQRCADIYKHKELGKMEK
jgi:hypothetical protein